MGKPRRRNLLRLFCLPATPPVNLIFNESPLKTNPPAIMKNETTLIPMRVIFEKLGAELARNGVTQTVTAKKGETEIKLKIGSTSATVNRKAIKLQAAPIIVGGSTMVPLCFVSEALGAKVGWDGYKTTVHIGEKYVKANYVNGIYVQYGRHTYESRIQEEYDNMMAFVDKALERFDDVNFVGNMSSITMSFWIKV